MDPPGQEDGPRLSPGQHGRDDDSHEDEAAPGRPDVARLVGVGVHLDVEAVLAVRGLDLPVFGLATERVPHGRVGTARVKASSNIRWHSAAKSNPAAAAALGSRLVSVIPGSVLTSSTTGRPSGRTITSTRP